MVPVTTKDPLEDYIDDKRILRIPKILTLVSISKATLYRWIDKGCFPPASFKQAGRLCWHFEVVQHWLDSRQK